jgi:H+-transporting ATPase
VLLVRERSYMWSSRPGTYLLLAIVGDVIMVSLLAHFGVFMAPVAWTAIGVLLAFTIVFVTLLDLIKVPLLRSPTARAAGANAA